jgi:hypothetical protein
LSAIRETLRVAGRDCVPSLEPAELEAYAAAAEENPVLLNSLMRLLNLAGGHDPDVLDGPSDLGGTASGQIDE